jgi:hypothetical protein
MTNIPIPQHWTADEALGVAAFLEDIVHAIWDTHGDAMGRRLQNFNDARDAALDPEPTMVASQTPDESFF